MAFRLEELARRVQGRVRGDGGRLLRGIATLESAGPEDLSFLTNPKYRAAAAATSAGAILVGADSGIEGRDLLEADEPYLALAKLLELFHPPVKRRAGISDQAWVAAGVRMGREIAVGPFAVIEEGVELGDRVRVGAGSVIGEGCRIGDDSELKPRVVLYPGTRLGRRCLVHSGVVLGGDGFGFATSGGRHRKVPQTGNVVVEDEVEIGANSAVDRGAVGETRIGEGTKIDDLVMIAHGARLGRGSLLAAQTGIAGSTRVGAGTVWAGQSGAAGHLEIADGTMVAAKSAVLRDISEKSFVAGIPAVDHRRWKRSQAMLDRLPELRREIRELKSRLNRLEQRSAREED